MHWKTSKGTFLIEKNRTPLPFVEGGIGLSQGERFQEAAEYYETSPAGIVIQNYGGPQHFSIEDEMTVSGIHRVIGDALYAFTWRQQYPYEAHLSVTLLLQNLDLDESPLPFDSDAVILARQSAHNAPPPRLLVADNEAGPNEGQFRPAPNDDVSEQVAGSGAAFASPPEFATTGLSSAPQDESVSDPPRTRHLACGICSQLRDCEQAVQHVHAQETDAPHLPEAAGRLVGVPDLPRRPELLRCPECGTYYLYESAYEFLIGFGGSYDEQVLTRLSDQEAGAHLKGRRTDSP